MVGITLEGIHVCHLGTGLPPLTLRQATFWHQSRLARHGNCFKMSGETATCMHSLENLEFSHRPSLPGESSKGVCLNHSCFCYPWPPAIWWISRGKERIKLLSPVFFFSLYATMFQKCILFGFILFLKQYSVPLVLQILTNIIYKKLTVYSDCEKTYLWFYLKHILSPREVFSFVYTR